MDSWCGFSSPPVGLQAILKSSPLLSSQQPELFFSSNTTSTYAHPLDNMGTSRTSNRSSNWNRFYAQWSREMKEHGLRCSPTRASKVWKKMSADEKAAYCVQSRKTPKLPRASGLRDRMHEDEDSVNEPDTLISTPVTQEEQLPASPLFSDFGSIADFFTFNEFPTAGPSALDQALSTGPSSVAYELPFLGPSTADGVHVLGSPFNMGQPSFNALSSPVEEPTVASISEGPLPAPTPIYPPGSLSLNNANFSFLNEAAAEWSTNFLGQSSAETSAGIWGSDLPALAPPTSTTGNTTLGLITPGLFSLPTGPENNRLGFEDFGLFREQQTWNSCGGFEYADQQSFAPPAPVFPTTAPALVPAPAPTSVSVPAVAGPSGQQTGIPADPHPWQDIARILESDPQAPPPPFPQAPPPPVPQQNVPPAILQRALDVLDPDNFGQEGKVFRLGPLVVQVWNAGR